MHDIETVFTQPNLEKTPTYQVPASEVFLAPKSGTMNWDKAQDHHKEAVDNILERIRSRAEIRRVLMKPVFQDFDKHNNGHVTRAQFRQALTILEIPAEQAEMLDLEARFCDDMGFNYKTFLEQVQPEITVKPMYVERLKELRRTNEKGRMPERRPKPDLEEILDKVKRRVCLERVRIHEWMRDFDKLRSGRMLKTNFRRCLDLCRFDLQESELAILEDHYQAWEDKDFVHWLQFCKDIESIFTTDELEKAPQLEPDPLQPLPEWSRNELPQEEEERAAQVLTRLAEKIRRHRMQLFPLFEDFDRVHNRTVSRSQFRRVLSELGLASLIPSEHEWNSVWMKFCETVGGRDDVNYVAFCDTVYDIANFEWRKP
jgi:Ca2+-binding EF-hand superfamily protein